MADDHATGDPSFDRYARLVQRVLGVPVGLVSLVEEHRQAFIGAVGLPAPYQQSRETPLSHSFCQYVVKDERPLVVVDARLDPVLHTNAAIDDLGVVAYAGWPLHDDEGRTVGSLCAIDSEPREWTAAELSLLEDLAAACSAELAQRGLRVAAVARAREVQLLVERGRVLLALSEALAATTTLTDVAAALETVAVEHLGCTQAGLWLDPGARATGTGAAPGAARPVLAHVSTPLDASDPAVAHVAIPADPDNAVGAAYLGSGALFYRDHEHQDAAHADVLPSDAAGGGRAFLPIGVGGHVVGTLVLVWPEAREPHDDDQDTVRALASYTAQAVQRALLLREREETSVVLQRALLSGIDVGGPLELAARYRPASTREQVGGDWYDAVALDDETTTLVVGDVVGHDIAAAADMGQVRATLRALAWAGGDDPAVTVARLDRAVAELRLDVVATVVLAQVSRHSVTWTSAGHPPPLLVAPDGSASFLEPDVQDPLVGIDPTVGRHATSAAVAPGSTLLMFTDGVVERRGEVLDAGLARLAAAAERHAGCEVEEFLDRVLAEVLADDLRDDVAVVAARFPD